MKKMEKPTIEFGNPSTRFIVLGALLSLGLFTSAIWIPAYIQPLGSATAAYLDSHSGDISFIWMHNCTLVNDNLSRSFSNGQESVYVDGLYIFLNGTSPIEKVLFAPYYENKSAQGQLITEQWNDLKRSLISEGIGRMIAAETHPEYFPHTWPISLMIEVYFEDLTFFYMGYEATDGLAYIQYGTWTGHLLLNGWPEVSDFQSQSNWLDADHYLDYAMTRIFEITTSAVHV
jgi:hypothetical protein